jgi:hypothetical protein
MSKGKIKMTEEKKFKDLFANECAIWDPFVKHYASQITLDQVDVFMSNLYQSQRSWEAKFQDYDNQLPDFPITLVGLTKDKLGVFSRAKEGFPTYQFDTCEQMVVGLQRMQRAAIRDYELVQTSNKKMNYWAQAVHASNNLQSLIHLGLDRDYVMRGRD